MSAAATAHTREDLRAFFGASLRGRAPGSVVSIQLPAPAVPPTVLLRALSLPRQGLWQPPDGPACAFSGVAFSAEVGEGGLAQARGEIERVLARIETCAPDGVAPFPARLFGGLAFEPGWGRDGPWEGFGDGAFVLPRWSLWREGERAVLAFAIEIPDEAGWEPKAVEELDRIWERLERAPAGRVEPLPALSIPARSCEELPYERWAPHIEAIRAAIGSGEFAKLVAARCSRFGFDAPLEVPALLVRLKAEYPGCTVFAHQRGAATFLGATPERLFQKKGEALVTEALAGSIGARDDEAENARQMETLLASAKDRREHQLVVEEIEESLAGYCAALDHPKTPRIKRVRGLLHLNTPFEGRLAGGASALELLEAMHPTPAVGGLPKRKAPKWIAAREEQPRGWYTGPVGWIDARGDADFWVAIRCGVVAGKTLHVFSGAGIMQDSDPRSEYEETRLKQQPLLRALGVTT